MPARIIGQDPAGRPQLDSSRPVPARSEVIQAWQRRQAAIRTFQFRWTERQTHPRGWLPNPRHPEREWSAIPGLYIDREYTISKHVAVDGNRMRYAFEMNRLEEPDGVRVAPAGGADLGLGAGRHYSYLSVFDGQRGQARLSSLGDSPPPATWDISANLDAQNLDLRAIMMSLRPLDPVMGLLFVDRAVANQMRTFYRGRSTFLLEERHDPSGWKTVVWIEPERGFLVSRFAVLFEQKWIVDIDIDYAQDRRWGWIPSGWRVTEMLSDGSRRVVVEAIVSSYSINRPIRIELFK